MIDLSTSYLGLKLRSPLMASSSPFCKDIGNILKDGVMAPGRGSLGEVLPQSVKELFAKAGLAALESPIGSPVTWTSASGAGFEWRPCPRAGGEPLVS
jgi:hypothetical protein